MSTLVFLHAHPDDETSLTAGMMALAADRGHRVVAVFATGGEHGTVPPDLPADTPLAEYRRREAEAAAAALGTDRIVWLGYEDSGMTGWEQNANPACLARADSSDVAAAVAALIDAEHADYLIGYDWHGNYGHPDHIAVHRAGRLAVEQAAHPVRLFEATNRREDWTEARTNPDAQEMMRAFGYADGMPDDEWDKFQLGDDGLPTGMPEADIAWRITLDDQTLTRKRQAMTCHASQTSDIGLMLALPPRLYRFMFGTEYLMAADVAGPPREHWPF
ncbi:PIG-L family deacetylase [Gordonia hydrophobica]|uniref:PIG-L family deacetylase n=1 Tax=Gordonia hydrophobica TaxID=40516 RepID=A0ABZ2U5N7_9ACTN|nr:PIG-L family deacetylase [Gordonia hydrophobica]MBM7368706.1 LmbE family N-acetylglucosaminyl deacetylase [Gordonia hydrophobica]